MSGSVQRWERQRAAWLTGHSSGHGGALSATMRRRAEILERSARRSERSGAGITATAVQDEISPGLWHRLTHDTDGSRHHRPRWALAMLACAVFLGLGLAVGHGAYRLLWRRSPTIGRLWAWPWAAVATGTAMALAVLGVGFRPALHLDRHFPFSLLRVDPWWALVGWQLVVAAPFGHDAQLPAHALDPAMARTGCRQFPFGAGHKCGHMLIQRDLADADKRDLRAGRHQWESLPTSRPRAAPPTPAPAPALPSRPPAG